MKIKKKTKKLLKDIAGYFIALIIFFSIIGSVLSFLIIFLGIANRVGITLPVYLVTILFYMTAIAASAIAWAVMNIIGKKKKSDSA